MLAWHTIRVGRAHLAQRCVPSHVREEVENVVKYLKPTKPKSKIVSVTFSVAKYYSGVDSDEKQTKDKGFDAHSIEMILKGPVFGVYVEMVCIGDGINAKFTSWGEACPCHEALIKGLSPKKRAKLFLQHYGTTTCPLAGCRLPDLADGALASFLDDLWAQAESELMTCQPYAGAAPLTAEGWQIVVVDFQT